MQITQSSATELVFFLASVADDKTAVTGVTPTVLLRKVGGSLVAATNPPAEISRGWYKVVTTTTESNTLGAFIIEAYGTGSDIWRDIHQVV